MHSSHQKESTALNNNNNNSNNINNSNSHPSDGDHLDYKRIQTYLASIRSLSVKLEEETSKSIEEDFVAARQEDTSSVSLDDFHVWLVLTRLYALSLGKPVIDINAWNKIRGLERDRFQSSA
jgi:hypothetical protein